MSVRVVDSQQSAAPVDWRARYARRLLVTDLLVLVWAVFGAQLLWFGFGNAQVAMRADVRISEVSYWFTSTLIVLVWAWALSLSNSRDYRVIGSGLDEYKRVFDASLKLFGVIAIIAFLTRIDVARGYLLIAFPLGLAVLWLTRWLWRQWIGVRRAQGLDSARVLLVGRASSVMRVARDLRRNRSAGYLVVGACVPEGQAQLASGLEAPVFEGVGQTLERMRELRADTVAITGADELTATRVRQISWELVHPTEHLVVAPALVDVAGPRVTTRPVSGLPLIHVESPQLTRFQGLIKRITDFVGSLILIVILSPLLIGLAIAVKVSSEGPIFYRQERIGHRGSPFYMLKFRSMIQNADAKLMDLLKEQGTAEQPLFKIVDDPRVTRVGKTMRRYSLDELPQLFNVLLGSMSLIGPRPQRDAEVELYDDAARRRLLMKPGMTGLWQVSGRSKLSWEEAVRLDLYYVENWSFAGDLMILLKTAKAVVSADGAY